MALTITNHQIRSTDTPHTAGLGDGGWTVTWLPGRGLTEGQAAAIRDRRGGQSDPGRLPPGGVPRRVLVPAWTPGRPVRPYRTPPPLCRRPRYPGPGDGLARGWLWRCRGCWSQEARRMSKRNTRQGKARRRAQRDRGQVTERERNRPRISDQGPGPSRIRRFRRLRGQTVLARDRARFRVALRR